MKSNKLIKTISIFFALLVFSIAFIPAISAQVEFEKNQKLFVPSQEEMEILKKENVTTLKSTATEEITATQTKEGMIYTMSWVDFNDSTKINFVFMSQDDLISSKYLDANEINDNNVISAVSKAYYSFWEGSYAQSYGNSLTGGVHIHFTKPDADYVIQMGTLVAPALGTIIGTAAGGAIGSAVGLAAGTLIAIGMISYYKFGKNSDGSIDVKMSYIAMNLAFSGLPGASAFILFGQVYFYFN
ncbi:MAG: hypothetical protein RBQ94_04465 [Methanimicrococcus sp.]|nr:hypothetical protein [Methanimicrococcus sp.]